MIDRLGMASILLAFVSLGSSERLEADITEIGPFVGDLSDPMNYTHPTSPSGTGSVSELEIFGGFATIFEGPAVSSVKIENGSTRGGDSVFPRSAPRIVGSFGVVSWEFSSGISQFGGYFENNSRFDDIELDLFDVNDNLIGSVTAVAPLDAQSWTWNGWHSDVPIHRLTTRGNDIGFDHGFVWYEDMEISLASIPEPTTWIFSMGLCSLIALRRNRVH